MGSLEDKRHYNRQFGGNERLKPSLFPWFSVRTRAVRGSLAGPVGGDSASLSRSGGGTACAHQDSEYRPLLLACANAASQCAAGILTLYGTVLGGWDAQEAFRSRVESRFFFPLELEESHLVPVSGLYSQSELEKQTPCLQKQCGFKYRSALILGCFLRRVTLRSGWCGRHKCLIPPPPSPMITRSGRARFLQIAWNSGTHVRNARLQPSLG